MLIILIYILIHQANRFTKEGFRKSSVEAPIRENLAAGILALSGWKPGRAFIRSNVW